MPEIGRIQDLGSGFRPATDLPKNLNVYFSGQVLPIQQVQKSIHSCIEIYIWIPPQNINICSWCKTNIGKLFHKNLSGNILPVLQSQWDRGVKWTGGLVIICTENGQAKKLNQGQTADKFHQRTLTQVSTSVLDGCTVMCLSFMLSKTAAPVFPAHMLCVLRCNSMRMTILSSMIVWMLCYC